MSQPATARRSGSLSWMGFPAVVRFLFLGDLVTAVGIGLTQPYLVVLLHEVKGVPLVTATAMTSLLALASFPGNWLSGTLADRLGGYRVMAVGLLCAASGLAVVASVDNVLPLGVGVAAVGFGWSVTLPAYATLIAAVVPEAGHTRVFTFQYALFNAGMGAGAATGAVLIRGAVGAGMALLWWIAAATCLAAVVTGRLAFLSSRTASPPPPPSPSSPPAAAPATTMRPAGGYRMVFADRALLRVLLAAVLMSAAGYGVYNSGLPVLAVLAADPAVMSWVSVANCLTVVVGLPLALRVGRRLRSPQLLVMTAAVWSAGWLLCTVHGQTLLPGARMTLPLAAALFGLGELLMAGALPAMVNALAPAALRGRYNAALTLAITSGMWVGPLLAAAAAALDEISLLFAAAVALLAAMAVLVQRPRPALVEPALVEPAA